MTIHHLTRTARRGCVLLALLAGLAVPGAAPAQSTPADRLSTAVEQVGQASAARFDARDSSGARLDGLKVIQSGGVNVGVYHAQTGDRFDLYVATSTDLLHWTRRAVLDRDASQGTIAALPGGGYVVAYEWANTADLLPRIPLPKLTLPPLLQAVQGIYDQLPRVRIRFRHYTSLANLLAGKTSREFTAPRQLAKTAEGTPHIGAVSVSGGVASSRIEVGLHHFADLNGDSYPETDRQATGVLTNFSSWQSRDAPELNGPLSSTTDLHAPFTTAPRGNLGDRDAIAFDGARLQIHEAQYRRGDFGSWRPFLLDVGAGSGAARALHVVTPGGSRAFGNPTVTELRSPAGRPALLVTMVVFSEESGPGEAGELVYYREL